MGTRWSFYRGHSSHKNSAPKVISGLTQREMKAIRLSWKAVSSDMKTNGTAFFIKFFEFHPAYLDYFPAFRDKTPEQLHRSLILQAHGISVMYSFTTLVENLNDEAYFTKFMKQSVRSHHNRGVSLKQYEEMFQVLIVFLEDKLGNSFNEYTRHSWERFAERFSAAVEKVRAQEKLGPCGLTPKKGP